jgi:hypothetical protein
MVVERDAGGDGGSASGKRSHSDEGGRPRKLVALARAKKEARHLLTEEQYWDLVGYVRRLIDFGDVKATSDLDIKPFAGFWELRLKGGFIRKINLRVYFAYVKERNEVVILMVYKKEEDRRVSPHIPILLEDRLEDYLLGAAHGISVHKRRGREGA